MLASKRIDPTECQDEPQTIIEYLSVTLQNASLVRDSVPSDQISQIEAGDEISVYAVAGSATDGPKRLTIWYNKEVAAIETAEGSIWGDWDEDEELLLTEEFEESQDVDDASVSGRIAYNLSGLRGIFSSGGFYPFINSSGD
jgi:hypothetical protein